MLKQKAGRLYEFDIMRGFALAVMLVWHTIYDLDNFFGMNIPYETGIMYYLGRIAITFFVMVAGVSCSFSRNNASRAWKILGVALLITLATQLYNPELVIKFGILHFFGLSILLYPIFATLNPVLLLMIGSVIIGLGNYFEHLNPSNNYLFIFNLTNGNWASADYYPMFPWFGLFLFGVALRKIAYPTKRTLLPDFYRPGPLVVMGQNSLLIYLLHQPIILLILNIIFHYYK